jgi:hypothetical protein
MRGDAMSENDLMVPLNIILNARPGEDEQPADLAPLPVTPGSLALDELDDDPDWLTGPAPKPTPMLLTLHKPGSRGADHLGHVGALPRGKVALLVSPGGVGKTALLCQLALAVATGRDWLDTFAVRGGAQRVVLALGEEDKDEIKLRLWNAADALGIRADAELMRRVRANLRILPLYGQDAKLLASGAPAPGSVSSSTVSNSTAAPSATAGQWMKEFAASGELALIIFDPLSRFIAGDENDNTNATNHITILEQFTKLPGKPTVLCAHHTNKGALNGDKAPSQGDARGASGLVDGPRWVAVLSKRDALDGQARAVFSLQKTNYTAPLEPIPIIRDGARWRPCTLSEQPDTKQPGGDEQPPTRPANKNKETSASLRTLALVEPGDTP